MTSIALTFDDVPTSLRETTFVIVDLETAGGKPQDAEITEIGAVKVRAGEVIGEFQTFCNPGVSIPAFISVLTGITDFHVAHAPSVQSAVAQFLAFASFDDGDSPVLVAHNAPFDVGFLKNACLKFGMEWPKPRILDTVLLARKILSKDEVRNCKLSTLAEFFHAETSPTHRALDDAKATVTVLHGLIERVGNLGIYDLVGLAQFNGKATEKRRRKRHLADGVPDEPGVYIFEDMMHRPLYVGTSSNMRKRVMSYFTAAETRSRMTQMVHLAEHVRTVVCRTPLEAQVRELRLIDELRPRYNHRSRNPERTVWVALTEERFPRLSIIRQAHPAHDTRTAIGPFRSVDQAENAMAAIYEAIPIRQCKEKISKTTAMTPCALYEMQRCIAPCIDGSQDEEYSALSAQLSVLLTSDCLPIQAKVAERMDSLAAEQRYEEATIVRDRLLAFSSGVHRASAIRMLSEIPELVAASPRFDGGWDVNIIKHGWLAGAGIVKSDDDARSVTQSIRDVSATHIGSNTLVHETELILRWLSNGTTRMVHISEGMSWAQPLLAKREHLL